MKKLFFFACIAWGMTAWAQHVTPLSVELTDVKLDSLRTLYSSEPTMYRASLAVVSQQLAKDADEIKAAKSELKVEQEHSKLMANSIKEAQRMAASLKSLYGKEESEVKSMLKTVEKQLKSVGKQNELNRETRDNYLRLLERQQKELSYAIRDVSERQRAVTELEEAIGKGKEALQVYVRELSEKQAALQKMEADYKTRVATVKSEQKSAKNMQ